MKFRNLYAIDENIDAEVFAELLMLYYEKVMDVRVVDWFTDNVNKNDIVEASESLVVEIFEREGTYWTKVKMFGGIQVKKIFAIEMEVEFITGAKQCARIMAQIPKSLGLTYH